MHGRSALASLTLLLACFAIVAALSRAQEPPPESLPSDTVAMVAAQPILKSDFDHYLVIAAAFEDRPPPGFGTKRWDRLRDRIMPVLISSAWIEGEATARHIVVSDRAVRRSFRRQKRQAFTSEAEYRKYLRDTKQTTADVLRRVRSDLLMERIRKQVQAAASTDQGRMRRLERFVRRFTRKWRARTTCGEGYTTERECSRTVPIALPSASPTPTPSPTPSPSPSPSPSPE